MYYGTYLDKWTLTKLLDKNILLEKQVGREDVSYYVNPLIPEFPVTLNFKDVALQQNKNVHISRTHVDIKSEVVRGVTLDVPVIASNMASVTNAKFCNLLEQSGAMGILHRAFKTTEEYLKEAVMLVSHSEKWQSRYAASVGVGYEQLELAKKLIQKGITIICIDIAHGYSEEVKLMALSIKRYSKDTKVIVGNIINSEALWFFDDAVDAVKVGIANGLACSTKNTAGCNAGQFSTIYDLKEVSLKLGLPIIADGGIREPADAVKAIGAGANTVMIGSMFAACPESSAEVIDNKKIYAGMASAYTMEKWGKNPDGRVEGKVLELDIGKPVKELLKDFTGALKSGITYAGCQNIEEFRKKAKFYIVK